ncbi:glycoside hydrolase domain-containing protein [Albibacterium bauzanense]|uniref:Glycoside hydrolase 123 catalytic domain-containing protein n=1 Tax=Albibacterium bauzanense TaxID=653929 RepID=A0A4R1LZ60_9SPHI|nr:glycoside hydrolase domain-containing protein [Albibacterium bauzanense]TCK84876.1 hypothetical protein C8N28_0171 [Albibacterium bauzanense]
MHSKEFRIFYIVFFLVTIGLYSCFAQTANKLKIKHTVVAPVPNYSKSGQSRDPLILIDGKLASHKILWLDNNTLGWENYGQITIDLELQETSSVSKIAIHTAKNEAAGVYLPLNINIFTSIDGNNYSYAGDISGYDESAVNTYKAVELQNDKINSNAKFIKLVINPQGRMFFTDEITITGKSKSLSLFQSSNILSKGQLQNIISKNKSAEINRRALIDKLYSMTGNANNKNEIRLQLLNEKDLANQQIYQKYQSLISGLSVSKNTVEGLSFEVLSSPWGNGKSEGKSKLILTPTNVTHYVAVRVKNNQNKEVSSSFVLKGINNIETSVYETQEINTRSSKNVSDVLLPITVNSKLDFNPGETKVLILALKSSQERKSAINLSLTGSNDQALVIDYQSINLGIDKNYKNTLNFNVNVWPYYTYPFFKGREQQIKQDLADHYSNIFVIPAKVLEPNNITTNHNSLINYLKNYQAGDKVMLFINHKGYVKSPGNYMQASWQKKFLTWYDTIYKILKDHNISDQDIYLYPFDEIRENELPLFKSFATWVKSVRPQSQIYLTIYYEKFLPQVQPLADVYQLLVKSNDLGLIKPNKGHEFWIYDIMDDSKNVDPYSRYRLLAWKAFQYNARGIGFWAYGDQFGSSVWDDFDGGQGDYNVVYDKGNSIIPSKRWEAFKQGVEDYFILNKYQQKFGEAAAKKLALQVLSVPTNQEKAEDIRRIMTQQLSK